MRHCQGVVLAVLTAGLGGCLTGPSERSPIGDVQKPFSGPTGKDVVQIDLAQIQIPLGDRYANHDLWAQADEQEVSLEQKPVLEANGFRVCQVGGVPPAGLQALLTSPRSCPDPHRIRLRAGTAHPVLLGPVWQHCAFRLHQGSRESPVDIEQAQCLLEIVPRIGEDGRTVLTFTPHLRHGQARIAPKPKQDPAGALHWEWDAGQPEEAYPWLGWQLTVTPNEYVVVGTDLERPDTLGQRCFLHQENAPRVQRLLVIRTTPVESSSLAPDHTVSRAPPLALQTNWSLVRGSAD